MKAIVQILLILLTSSSIYSQDRPLDSICLNLAHQEFALNELSSENIQFDSIILFKETRSGLTIKIQVLDSSYFFLSNWVLKQDTVTFTSRSGEARTEVLKGADYVLGNKLIIQNNTDSSVRVPIEDHQLVLVQEAKDPEGNWLPIEYFIHSDCGNSYSAFHIPAHMSYQLMIAKYCGEFKTKLRVRISLNNEVYISEEFDGYVNLNQLKTSSRIPSKGFLRENLFNVSSG